MADRFVFSNFAVAALQEGVDAYATQFEIHPNDVDKFPVLTQGSKFPIVMQDTQGFVEICWATSLNADGVMDVERGQENTTPKSWLAGTQVMHTMTAGTIFAAAKLTPKGPWLADVQYGNGDVVVYAGVSYMGVTPSLGVVPSALAPEWQVLYQPPGAASSAMSQRGKWSNTTTYAVGEVVDYYGRQYVAIAASTGQLPTNATYWDPFSLSESWFQNHGMFKTSAANTDNIVIDAGLAGGAANLPTAHYDGMTVKFVPGATNAADNVTITIGGLAPKPLRKAVGTPIGAGNLYANSLYEATYNAAGDEFILTRGVKPWATEVLASAYSDIPGGNVQGMINELANRRTAPGTSYSWAYQTFTNGFVVSGGTPVFNTLPYFRGNIRVETTAPQITMYDTEWGPRYIHMDAGTLGFLNNGGGWNFHVDNSGNLWTAANITAYSDARLKKNFRRIVDALDKVGQLRTFLYDRKDVDETQVGLIAQDVERVLPTAVTEDKIGVKTVAENQVLALVVQALNELHDLVRGMRHGTT